jgi:hypothetical protein
MSRICALHNKSQGHFFALHHFVATVASQIIVASLKKAVKIIVLQLIMPFGLATTCLGQPSPSAPNCGSRRLPGDAGDLAASC